TMKKTLVTLIITFSASLFPLHTVFAQQELWGMTQFGGETASGVIFKTDINGQNPQSVYDFQRYTGSSPSGHVVEAENGILYGLTYQGGLGDFGVLFAFDPATAKYTVKVELDSDKGRMPESSMVLANSGLLYGVTASGGPNGYGVIFEFDPATDTYTVKFGFDGPTYGELPLGTLLEAANGKLYGTTYEGGTFDKGVLFEYNPLSSLFVKKVDFDGTSKGANPHGSLIQAANGKLYGLTSKGGTNDMGVLFSYDIVTSAYTKIIEFDGTNYGSQPYGSLLQTPDNMLYGMTYDGGNNNLGTIFVFNPATNAIVKKLNFNGATTGAYPYGSLIDGGDGYLYGLTYAGGINSTGVMFKYDPLTDDFVKLVDFYDDDYGENPYDDLFLASNGKMYGTTFREGKYNKGTFFEYNPANNTYTKVFDFNASEKGAVPLGGLLNYSKDKLFGMTPSGGEYMAGVIFEINPQDNSYTVRYNFDWLDNGGSPYGTLMLASNGKLYGVTYSGGTNYAGTLFEFDPVSYVFLKLFDFDGTNYGERPLGNLCEGADAKIYGTTERGGVNSLGVLFSYDPLTTNFIKLFDFGPAYGGWPYGGLVLADNEKLYGGTYKDGSFNEGVLYEYDPVTFNFQVKVNFDGTNQGAHPHGTMINVDGKLYGTTLRGGVNNNGVLYEYDPDADLFTKKIDFDEAVHGAHPAGSLFEASNGKLFGLTSWAGIHNSGTVFSYDISTNSLEKTADFSGPDGQMPRFCQLIEVEGESGVSGSEDQIASLFISPNPASDYVIIRYRMQEPGRKMIGIFSIEGKKIQEDVQDDMQKGTYEMKIDVSDLPGGVYIVRMQAGKDVSIKKLIVK
ncbi:MAG: choice-of-anchor tandem repeat GloVer-containing protein, partial [Bacteroidota bacterium]|nr:choice-of-anchor tandem repeat GloVer-containing protein [Bacteroidota bacterium]